MEELICLPGGLPLRGCVCAGGLVLRKRITNRAKGAEKPKGFQKGPLSCSRENQKKTVDLAALGSEEASLLSPYMGYLLY